MTTSLSSPAPSLRFEAADHRYWLGDRELLSVTTILKAAGLMESSQFTMAAADRGTYVHQACDLVDDDDLGAIDPACAGYVAAYQRFLAEARPEWAHREHAVCDPTLGYAGTLDRAGTLNGRWTVLDIKTGSPAPWHGVQLAAYGRLVPRDGLKPDRFDLYLRADGTYQLWPQTGRNDDAIFLAALLVAQFRRTHGLSTR